MLLSLLLMAAITASTIAVSTVISNSGRQSKTVNDFILASLQADSGLERALGVIKAGRQSKALDESAIAAAELTSERQVDVSPASATPLSIPLLPKNQSATFDILDNAATVHFLKVGGNASGATVAEISWVIIDQNGDTNFSGRIFKTAANLNTPAVFNLEDNVRTASSNVAQLCSCSPLGFRIRIRALNGNISQLAVTAYDDQTGSTPVPLQSRISIVSTGKVGVTQSQKTASVLWQRPASPLFNYILFTEGGITPE